jgi:hypothetical protein
LVEHAELAHRNRNSSRQPELPRIDPGGEGELADEGCISVGLDGCQVRGNPGIEHNNAHL